MFKMIIKAITRDIRHNGYTKGLNVSQWKLLICLQASFDTDATLLGIQAFEDVTYRHT